MDSSPNRVLVVWQNPLFRETVQAILAAAKIPAETRQWDAEKRLETGTEALPSVAVVEGDREAGCAFLHAWPSDRPVCVVAFTLDERGAYLLDYRPCPELTRDVLVRLIGEPSSWASSRSSDAPS